MSSPAVVQAGSMAELHRKTRHFLSPTLFCRMEKEMGPPEAEKMLKVLCGRLSKGQEG